MITALIIFHVIVCIMLTVTVLLQFGKGAEVGAVMGGGASQQVFNVGGKGDFFSKLTPVLAILFMINSIALTHLKSKESKKSIFDGTAPVVAPISAEAPPVPAAPVAAEPTAAPTTTPTATAPAQK